MKKWKFFKYMPLADEFRNECMDVLYAKDRRPMTFKYHIDLLEYNEERWLEVPYND